MNDSKRQDGQAAAVPAGDLTRCLLRRATAPIGVIDTRLAFSLHSRASLWLGQRMELLAILKSRYGVDQGAGGTAGTAVTATMPLHTTGASYFDLAAVPSSGGHAKDSETPINTASKTSPVAEAQHFRVKRANTQLESNPSKPLSPQTIPAQPPAAGGSGSSANSAVAIQPHHKASGTQGEVSGTPNQSALPPGRPAEADIRGQAEDKPAAWHDSATAADSLAQVSELSRTAIAAQMPLPPLAPEPTRDGMPGDYAPTSGGPSSWGPAEDKYAARPDRAFGTDALAQVSELPRTAIAAQMPLPTLAPEPTRDGMPGNDTPTSASPSSRGLALAHKAEHPPAIVPARSVRTTETVNPPLVQRAAMPMYVESTPRRDALPDHAPPLSSSPSFTGLLLQRSADQPPAVPAASSVRTLEAVSALPVAGAPSHGAVSAEIHTAPLLPEPADIVWRKAQPTAASRESAAPGPDLASGPTYVNGFPIMREAAAEQVPRSMVPVAMRASARNGGEIAAIAEQVSRIIARQLRAERMRRGRTR